MKLDELIEYSKTHWDEYKLRWSKLEDKDQPCPCGGKRNHECLDCWDWYCSDCIDEGYKTEDKDFYLPAADIPYSQLKSVEAIDRWQWTCRPCLEVRLGN